MYVGLFCHTDRVSLAKRKLTLLKPTYVGVCMVCVSSEIRGQSGIQNLINQGAMGPSVWAFPAKSEEGGGDCGRGVGVKVYFITFY